MSSRTILSRPRTRVYDANYKAGESYYKSAIDRLDRKYSGRPLTPPRDINSAAAEIAERHAAAFADDDLISSRKRAEKLISENHLFDSRGGRIGRASDMYENGVDDETATTLKRIRANKKVSIIDDIDLENTSNNLKTYRMLDRSDKILNTVGINENSRRALDEEVSFKRRSLNVSANEEKEGRGTAMEKWSAIAPAIEERETAAASRARQSRQRIDDIDDEMAAMAEKSAARERRVARLRALVAESESETVDDVSESMQSVSVSSRKEKKSVRF